jgi:GT2 family glycosyltransferase
MADPKVGVVTVTFNSAKVIDGFTRSLLAQTHQDFVLYVIDNASTDDTLAKLACYRDPRIQVLANDENKGVAAANNQGIRASLRAGCELIWLINNDTEFEPRLLETLVAGLAAQDCDLILPKIMYYDAPERVWFAGGYFSRWRAYATLHYGKQEVDHGQFDTARQIDYAPTCCMLIRQRVFEQIGLMDETYFVYYDDADFCFRARRAGLRILYYPSAVLLHKESSLTGGAQSPFALRLSARNKLYFLKKNLGPVWLLWAALYEVYLLGRLVSGRDSWQAFSLRQQSLCAGVRLKSGPPFTTGSAISRQ